MKIISKYHDYYDSVGSYFRSYNTPGFNNDYIDVVFKRNEIYLDCPAPNELPKGQDVKAITPDRSIISDSFRRNFIEAFNLHRVRYLNSFYRNNLSVFQAPNALVGSKYSFEYFTILFCGKVYYCVQLHLAHHGEFDAFRKDYTPSSIDEYFYSIDDLVDYVSEWKDGDLLKELEVPRTSYQRKSPYSYLGEIRRFLEGSGAQDSIRRDFLIENKITIALMKNDTIGLPIYVNPELQKYQFYRAVDAFTAYQEVDMWVSGTLAFPPNFMVEIGDEYKVESHGFDKKYSFRKRPTKK